MIMIFFVFSIAKRNLKGCLTHFLRQREVQFEKRSNEKTYINTHPYK